MQNKHKHKSFCPLNVCFPHSIKCKINAIVYYLQTHKHKTVKIYIYYVAVYVCVIDNIHITKLLLIFMLFCS